MEDNTEITLTDIELRIVRLIAKGRTTPAIATELFLSENTIKWYRKRIIKKFSASTSAEVVRKAIEANII